MPPKRYLTAAEAADLLNITLATLYAYVSRGLIRSEMVNASKRQRRYYAEDVEKLLKRKEATHRPEIMAETAMNWGTPILDSALTLILEGRLYYRGQDVIALAQTAEFEDVATLLWEHPFESAAAHHPTPDFLPDDLSAITRMQIALPYIGANDLGALDFRPHAVAQTGARILRMLTTIASREVVSTSISDSLRLGWHLPGSAGSLINAALILCADHELNASSMTARIVASTGGDPYAVVSAGLAALSGSRHGGHTARVAASLLEIEQTDRAQEAIIARLRRGEQVPGFGHRLYPDGDPRAAFLLGALRKAHPSAPFFDLVDAIQATITAINGEHPTIDFALVLLERLYDLPKGSALTLFALGRTVGWVAHAIEQYKEGRMLRPRARYVGEQPGEVG